MVTRAYIPILIAALCSIAAALDCTYYTAYPAYCDPAVCNTGGGHVLYLFDNINGVSQFVFTSEEGLVTVGPSLLHLQGTLVPLVGSSNGNTYEFEIIFEQTTGMGMNQLVNTTVDMSSWEYYNIVSGFMRNTGALGTVYQIQQQMADMPMQVGFGANGKNTGFGASIWIDLVFGESRIAGDFDLDLNCTTPSSSSSSDSCPAAPFFSVNADSIYACYTQAPDSLDANILFADGYTFNWHPLPVFTTADNCYTITLPCGHGQIIWVQVNGFDCHYGEDNAGRAQNCGANLCTPGGSPTCSSSSSSSVESSSSSSVESSSSSAPAPESSSSAPAPESSSSAPAPESSSSAPAPESSSSVESSSSSAPSCPQTCPAAPFFSVNSTEVYACFTTLPDSDMDANIRYEDGTIFNWHPYGWKLDSNGCLAFFVPPTNAHGPIVWAQVNGFNCHYGEDNSGREQNCGWNLCNSCGEPAPVTTSLPSGVTPYNPVAPAPTTTGSASGSVSGSASGSASGSVSGSVSGSASGSASGNNAQVNGDSGVTASDSGASAISFSVLAIIGAAALAVF